MPHSIPRLLQQQPQRYFSREQQQQQEAAVGESQRQVKRLGRYGGRRGRRNRIAHIGTIHRRSGGSIIPHAF